MRTFSNKIQLTRNSRGLWCLDPLLGCKHGSLNGGKGCYGVCYASSGLKCRGYEFDKPVKRCFEDDEHYANVANKIIGLPFVRLGVNCDPSDDWEHTISIVNKIRSFNKNIVIVTKHWNNLTEKQAEKLRGLFVNTSISALDSQEEQANRIEQYQRLKSICHSILRVNTINSIDASFNEKQIELLKNDNVIDNVLRFRTKQVEGLIIEKMKFLKGVSYVSKLRKESYLGDCYGCKDLCGVGMFKDIRLKRPPAQTTLFEAIK